MRFALLTASTLAMLLPTGLLLAQEAAADFESVYVDVDGAAVQISVALAAEACGLDEAAVQQAAITRLEESGLDPSVMQAAGNDEDTEATADAASEGAEMAPDASNQTVTTAQGTADPSTAEPGDEMLALAVCQIDVVKAAELGIPQANEIVTD